MSNAINIALQLNRQSAAVIKQHKKLLIFQIINHVISFGLFAIAIIPLTHFDETLIFYKAMF